MIKKISLYKLYIFSLILSMYFLIFSVDIGVNIRPIMIFLIPGFFIIIFKGIKINILNYEKVFLIFVLYSLIRGVFSQDKEGFIRMFLGYFFVLLVYIISDNIFRNINIKDLEKIFIIASFIATLISFILFISKFPPSMHFDKGFYRMGGLLPDPNFLGLYLTPIYGLLLFKILNSKKIRMYLIIIISIILICIFLTWSRSAFLGLAILSLMLIYRFNKIGKKKIIYIIIFLLIIYISTFFVDYIEIIEKMSGMDLKTIFQKRFVDDNGGSGRLVIWNNGIAIFKINPIFGIGALNFRYYNMLLFNEGHFMHNTFLEILCENGIIGMSIFIIFIILFIKNKTYNKYSILIKCIIIAMLIQAFFLTALLTDIFYIMFVFYKILNRREGIT